MKKKSIRKVLVSIQDICSKSKCCDDSCPLYYGLCYGSKKEIRLSELEETVIVIKEKLDEQNKNITKNNVCQMD